jgi:hypothetical protein
MIGKVVFDCSCKSLFTRHGQQSNSLDCLDLFTYIASLKHLFCKIFRLPFVCSTVPICSKREDVLQIRHQESSITLVCQSGIFLRGNELINVQVIFAKIVEDKSTKVRGVGDIGDFVQLFWEFEI